MRPSTEVPADPYLCDYEEDERLARELFQQEQDEQLARDLEEQIRREAEFRSAARASAVNRHHQDATVAQTLQDEDLARQLAREEERALQQQQQAAANVVTPSRTRRLCTTAIPCCILAVAMAVTYFVMRANNAVPGMGGGGGINIPGLPPFLRDNDPFDGLEPGEVARWRTRGNSGLQLEVLNALEQDWHSIFDNVVADWDNGTPDVLELTPVLVDPDPSCTAVDGASKICNGNYGATEWKGINMAVVQLGYIYASVSQMNEFYLRDASTTQRRYTLCHEMGHSFGLPHTDENFYNEDLGNCLDYTNNPAANLSPDETNFEFLKELYGVRPGAENTGNGTRSLLPSKIPAFVHQAMKQVLEQEANTHRALRVDVDTTPAEMHTITTLDLEEGWSLQIQKLI